MATTENEIKNSILNKLYWDERVDASNIKVTVKGGVVWLSGISLNYLGRYAVEKDTSSVPGVREIHNDIIVQPVKEEESIPQDREVKKQVIEALRWNPRIDSGDIGAEVVNGAVILRGTVDTFWKKQFAESLICTIRGVRSITNDLGVVPSRDISDKQIADDLISRLAANPTIDINALNIQVTDGLVMITGKASSWKSYQNIVSIARFTEGMKEIRENIDLQV